MDKQHHYITAVEWTGNTGAGTASYRGYERRHEIMADGKPAIAGSSDPSFRGDPSCYNPEELLVASLSACHMLSYLGLCANGGVVVTRYVDRAEGVMMEGADGSGRLTRVVLRPDVTLAAGSDVARAEALHHAAHAKCFIANSVNFPVEHAPVIRVESASSAAG